MFHVMDQTQNVFIVIEYNQERVYCDGENPERVYYVLVKPRKCLL